MIRTRITDAFDLSSPILSAGIPFAARPELAAAVSNAGGMGFLGADLTSAHTIAEMINTTRGLTSRAFGIGFLTPFVTDDQIDVCLTNGPAAVAFFRERPAQTWIRRLHEADIRVLLEADSPTEAKQAVGQGADAVIVHGDEAFGYPSSRSLLTLLPAVVDTVSPVPVIASGGIADGRRLAATLVLGADAAWCSTRFLASTEARRLRHQETNAGPSARGIHSPPVWGDTCGIANELVFDLDRVAEHLRVAAVSAAWSWDVTDQTVPAEMPLLVPTYDVVREVAIELGGIDTAGTIWQIKPAAQIVRDMSKEADLVLADLMTVARRSPA